MRICPCCEWHGVPDTADENALCSQCAMVGYEGYNKKPSVAALVVVAVILCAIAWGWGPWFL